MNIQFTISVNNFKKAASVEDMLKAQGIAYSARVDDKPSLGSSRRTRQVVGKDEILAVTTCLSAHPDWTVGDVAKSTGVGKSTVGRIRLGTHASQLANGKDRDSSIHKE